MPARDKIHVLCSQAALSSSSSWDSWINSKSRGKLQWDKFHDTITRSLIHWEHTKTKEGAPISQCCSFICLWVRLSCHSSTVEYCKVLKENARMVIRGTCQSPNQIWFKYLIPIRNDNLRDGRLHCDRQFKLECFSTTSINMLLVTFISDYRTWFNFEELFQIFGILFQSFTLYRSPWILPICVLQLVNFSYESPNQ